MLQTMRFLFIFVVILTTILVMSSMFILNGVLITMAYIYSLKKHIKLNKKENNG